jgi:hypothetical protein
MDEMLTGILFSRPETVKPAAAPDGTPGMPQIHLRPHRDIIYGYRDSHCPHNMNAQIA